MGFEIETKIAGFNGLRRGGTGGLATQGRANSREELVHPERLRHVIVGAGIERFDLCRFFAANRKHNDGYVGDFSEAPAQLETAHVRHRQIGYYQRRQPIAKGLQRKFTIAGDPHVISLSRQTAT